jgi:anti-sigma B factor antagonist
LIAVHGDLDLTTAGELRRRVDAELADGGARLIIDLSEVTHMDSTGLAELIYVQQRTAEVRGSLALVVTSPGLRRTLEIRGIDRLFTVTASAAEARAVLSTPGQPGDEPPLRE